MADCIAAIKQGTTSTHCSIFDHSGQILASAQNEHRQIYLQNDRVEQHPLEIWDRVREVISNTESQINSIDDKLVAVGIANQRETTIVWDKQTGIPYYNAIVWLDTRTKGICERLLSAGYENLFRSRTGLPLATYFSGPKIKWILDNVTGVREAANRGDALFGTVDSWLIWWLTGGPGRGVHITDVTNASRTLLFNIESLDWDDDLLQLLAIPRQMLPRIVPSSDPLIWGTTEKDGPFAQAIPVCGDLGEQQASLMAQACFQPGDANCSFSSACFILLNTGKTRLTSQQGLLTSIAYQLGNESPYYTLEGSISCAESLVRWMQDQLKSIQNQMEFAELAKTVQDNGGVLIIPPESGLYSPYWNSTEKCAIQGINPFVARGHLARAALEVIAFQIRLVIDAMKANCDVMPEGLKVDGTMSTNNLLLSLAADILGMPVMRSTVTDTASLGAAYAAGMAAGFWDGLEDLKMNWQPETRWLPRQQARVGDQMYFHWLRAVDKTLSNNCTLAQSR